MRYIYLIILMICSIFSGCSYNSFNTNRVTLVYNNMKFTARMSPLDFKFMSVKDRNPQFPSIMLSNIVHMNSLPIEIDFDIYIEMANGKTCHAPDLMKESIANDYAAKVIENGGSMMYEEWSKVYILADRWKVAYDRSGNLLYFSNYVSESTKNEPAAVWDSGLKKRYVLPLSFNDVKELFGEPDEILESKAYY